ncbi:MAG: nucleotide-binding protein [Candidatus ainarchaeum sp.]|nr:nucleotide-binding protein [Candidatus ainarchaeum sp.]
MPRDVVLDTNFLLLPFQFRINIIRELDYLIEVSHRYVISSRTLDELKKLGKLVGKNGMAARLALKMVKANSIDVIRSGMPVDDWVVRYAKENGAIACTNDRILRKRLMDLDVKVVTLKARSKLGFA